MIAPRSRTSPNTKFRINNPTGPDTQHGRPGFPKSRRSGKLHPFRFLRALLNRIHPSSFILHPFLY